MLAQQDKHYRYTAVHSFNCAVFFLVALIDRISICEKSHNDVRLEFNGFSLISLMGWIQILHLSTTKRRKWRLIERLIKLQTLMQLIDPYFCFCVIGHRRKLSPEQEERKFKIYEAGAFIWSPVSGLELWPSTSDSESSLSRWLERSVRREWEWWEPNGSTPLGLLQWSEPAYAWHAHVPQPLGRSSPPVKKRGVWLLIRHHQRTDFPRNFLLT